MPVGLLDVFEETLCILLFHMNRDTLVTISLVKMYIAAINLWSGSRVSGSFFRSSSSWSFGEILLLEVHKQILEKGDLM